MTTARALEVPADRAEDRRRARHVLRIAEGLCGYAGQRLDRGASPAAAAWIVASAGEELSRIGQVLAGLSHVDLIRHRDLVLLLESEGMSRPDICLALGLPRRTVAGYLREAGR